MSNRSGFFIMLGLFAVAGSLVFAARAYDRATPRYFVTWEPSDLEMNDLRMIDNRTGEIFFPLGGWVDGWDGLAPAVRGTPPINLPE